MVERKDKQTVGKKVVSMADQWVDLTAAWLAAKKVAGMVALKVVQLVALTVDRLAESMAALKAE